MSNARSTSEGASKTNCPAIDSSFGVFSDQVAAWHAVFFRRVVAGQVGLDRQLVAGDMPAFEMVAVAKGAVQDGAPRREGVVSIVDLSRRLLAGNDVAETEARHPRCAAYPGRAVFLQGEIVEGIWASPLGHIAVVVPKIALQRSRNRRAGDPPLEGRDLVPQNMEVPWQGTAFDARIGLLCHRKGVLVAPDFGQPPCPGDSGARKASVTGHPLKPGELVGGASCLSDHELASCRFHIEVFGTTGESRQPSGTSGRDVQRPPVEMLIGPIDVVPRTGFESGNQMMNTVGMRGNGDLFGFRRRGVAS